MYTASEILAKAARREGSAPQAYARPLGMRSSAPKAKPRPNERWKAAQGEPQQTVRAPTYDDLPPAFRKSAPAREAAPQQVGRAPVYDDMPPAFRKSAPTYEPAPPARAEAPQPPKLAAQMNPAYVPPPKQSSAIYRTLMEKHDRMHQRHL